MSKLKNKEKILKGMPGYFEKVENIILGQTPIDFLMVNTLPICNYQCKKCFTWAGKREIKNPLTLKKILSLIEKGRNVGAKVVAILGEGEPLVYKHIKKIIAYINKLKMIPLVATNGMLLSKRMVDFFIGENATIVASLDTLNKGEYHKFCGGNANLLRVLKNIEYARKRFSKKIYKNKGYKIYSFAIHMTITAKNYKNLFQIKKFCGEDIYFDSQPLANIGEAEKNPGYIGSEKIHRCYQKVNQSFQSPMVLTKTERGKEICGLFYYGLSIGYEGEAMFDAHAIDSKCIGHINDYSFERLIEKVRKLKSVFIKKYATTYCPVRDKNYKKFLTILKNGKY